MVSGINFSNYTVDQLKELKANGVEVPDTAIAEAQKKEKSEASEAKKSDEANISYKIEDDASKTNEAQAEVEAAAEYGANLKTILENLMSKCDTKNSEMSELQTSIDEFKEKSTATGNQLDAITTLIESVVAQTTTSVEEKQNSIETKKAEADKKEAEAETIVNNASPEGLNQDEKTKVTDLTNSATEMRADISDLINSIDELKNSAKTKTASAQIKAQALGTTLETIKNNMTKASNDAINANEYADVTIEKGTEAANISSKGDAKAAGFTKRRFLGGRKGNVGAANRMGNQAIAKGERLGGSTTNIATGVKDIAQQYNLSFAKTSGINELASKEYVDTTAYTEAENKDTNSFIKRITTQKEADKVAEASKNKGQKTEEATTDETKKKVKQ